MGITAVTAIIADRLRPAGLSQDDPVPSADMRIAAGTHDHHIEGISGLVTSSVTFDCYGDDPETADDLASAMMYSGIAGYRGTLAGLFINGVQIISGPTQSVEGVNPGSQQRRYVTSFTLQIIYSRACR
jgi:hypothetical protein